jgi:hypothetical protein
MPIVNGWVEVEASALFAGYGSIPKPIVTSRSRKFNIDSGSGKVEMFLVDSETSGVTYQFRVGYTETIAIPPQPPNNIPELISRDIVINEFFALVPRPLVSNSSIDLADLIPCNMSLSTLDSTIGMVADRIVSDPNLRMRANLFRFVGQFDQTKSYHYGDVVNDFSVGVRSFVCIVEETNPGAIDQLSWMRLT